MGECGCTIGNQTFKLKAPNGWYVIELLSGCKYCAGSPGIQIYNPEATEYFDDIEYMPDLPTIGRGEHCVTMIKCGLDPDEARTSAIKCFTGSETEDNHIDEILAEILGEDFWDDVLCKSPSVLK